MFSKFSILALVVPLVCGLQLSIPENPTSGGQITIKWVNEQGDPSTWSFELTNNAFNDAFAIANNVDPASNSITLTLPIVPVGDGYTLEAVNIGNITDVFASTGDFAIGAATTSLSSTATATTSTTGTKTATGVTSTTATTTQVTTQTSVTPGFSSVISPASTGSSASQTTANGAASTSTTPSTTPTSAALSSRVGLVGSTGGFAAALLSAVAGAAMLAL